MLPLAKRSMKSLDTAFISANRSVCKREKIFEERTLLIAIHGNRDNYCGCRVAYPEPLRSLEVFSRQREKLQ